MKKSLSYPRTESHFRCIQTSEWRFQSRFSPRSNLYAKCYYFHCESGPQTRKIRDKIGPKSCIRVPLRDGVRAHNFQTIFVVNSFGENSFFILRFFASYSYYTCSVVIHTVAVNKYSHWLGAVGRHHIYRSFVAYSI